MKGKIHCCPIGFTTLCGATPKELRIAMNSNLITCNRCRKIRGLMVLVWSENGRRVVTQKQYPQGEVIEEIEYP